MYVKNFFVGRQKSYQGSLKWSYSSENKVHFSLNPLNDGAQGNGRRPQEEALWLCWESQEAACMALEMACWSANALPLGMAPQRGESRRAPGTTRWYNGTFTVPWEMSGKRPTTVWVVGTDYTYYAQAGAIVSKHFKVFSPKNSREKIICVHTRTTNTNSVILWVEV